MQSFTKDGGSLFSCSQLDSMMIFKGELLEAFPCGYFKRCNCLPHYERHSIHLFYGLLFLFFLLSHTTSLKRIIFECLFKNVLKKKVLFCLSSQTFDIKKKISLIFFPQQTFLLMETLIWHRFSAFLFAIICVNAGTKKSMHLFFHPFYFHCTSVIPI